MFFCFFPPLLADRVKQSPGRFSKTKQVVLWLDFPKTLVYIHHTLRTVWWRLFCGVVSLRVVWCVCWVTDTAEHVGQSWEDVEQNVVVKGCFSSFSLFLIVDQKNLLWNYIIKAHYQCGCVCTKENMKPKLGIIKPSFFRAERLLPKPHVWKAGTCVPTSFTPKASSSARWKHSHLSLSVITWCRELFLLRSYDYAWSPAFTSLVWPWAELMAKQLCF